MQEPLAIAGVAEPRQALVRKPAGPALADRLTASRRYTEQLAAPLTDEDMTVQAMADASPTKWHLAHTTWFYEAFVLVPHAQGYRRYSDDFEYCFNSYYNTFGARQPRASRGVLTRPPAAEVREYRSHVDNALLRLLASRLHDSRLAALIELGINHEQQHQELLLTDILALFAANPLRPAYRIGGKSAAPACALPLAFVDVDGGIVEIGHDGRNFAYDNEQPRHAVLLRPFRIANRCVTNREWLAFISAGGYADPQLWLADGWAAVLANGWRAPEYWEQRDGSWRQMTLEGLIEVDPEAPVSHVSYYEADAFARWSGKRLPTEQEWETAARTCAQSGEASGPGLRPTARPPARTAAGQLSQLDGEVWQWTQSAYLPYPGYRPPPGGVGEYNGKFMCGQHVLKGSSCFTPAGHSRITYRNFFYPHQRWQMSGLRLAEDAS